MREMVQIPIPTIGIVIDPYSKWADAIQTGGIPFETRGGDGGRGRFGLVRTKVTPRIVHRDENTHGAANRIAKALAKGHHRYGVQICDLSVGG